MSRVRWPKAINRRQLQELGVPPECAKAAILALGRAADEGSGMGLKGQRAWQLVAAAPWSNWPPWKALAIAEMALVDRRWSRDANTRTWRNAG